MGGGGIEPPRVGGRKAEGVRRTIICGTTPATISGVSPGTRLKSLTALNGRAAIMASAKASVTPGRLSSSAREAVFRSIKAAEFGINVLAKT